VFRAAGVLMPFGFERLKTPDDIAKRAGRDQETRPRGPPRGGQAQRGLLGRRQRAVLLRRRRRDAADGELAAKIKIGCPRSFEAPNETWEAFAAKYEEMQGVVEAFVEGEVKTSPSVQCRVNAIGEPQVISTHDQVLGGPSGQVFLGCTFPAATSTGWRSRKGPGSRRPLAKKGVIGSVRHRLREVRQPDRLDSLRHRGQPPQRGNHPPVPHAEVPHRGAYNLEDGLFYAQSGRPKYYFATDTVQSERYKGLRAEDLVDIAVYHGLHFHGPTERGVVFHLIGALSEFGKLGIVSIGDNLQQARFLYKQTLQVLDEETGSRRGRSVAPR
jgi:hypothetical protein